MKEFFIQEQSGWLGIREQSGWLGELKTLGVSFNTGTRPLLSVHPEPNPPLHSQQMRKELMK
jgi:hypothetical protein